MLFISGTLPDPCLDGFLFLLGELKTGLSRWHTLLGIGMMHALNHEACKRVSWQDGSLAL